MIDTRHEPVIGASVLEKGTSNGTITNLDGEYSLKVSPGATLVFSYIGYKTQEIRVSANTNINVTLAEDAEQLQEVVVVGYGVQKKSSLTGSVASVSSKEIVKQLLQMLHLRCKDVLPVLISCSKQVWQVRM